MLHLHFILQYGMYNDIYILYLCSTTRSFVLTRILTSKGRLKRGPFILKLYQTTFKYKFPFFLSYYPLTCNIVCILRKELQFASIDLFYYILCELCTISALKYKKVMSKHVYCHVLEVHRVYLKPSLDKKNDLICTMFNIDQFQQSMSAHLVSNSLSCFPPYNSK